jgi:hypothetical protein
VIRDWRQWWDAHFESTSDGRTGWVSEPALLPQMSPKFRSIYDHAQKRMARSWGKDETARRYIAVTTRKYRARRKR